MLSMVYLVQTIKSGADSSKVGAFKDLIDGSIDLGAVHELQRVIEQMIQSPSVPGRSLQM